MTSGSVRRWRCEGLPLSCSCLRVFACSILRSRRSAPKPMRPAFRSACVFTASSLTRTAATPPYLNATPQRRVGRRNVSSIPTPIHTSRAPASSIAPRGTGGIDTISSQITPVDSPAPANGIIGASGPLRLADRACSRVDGKIVVIVRDPEHQLFLDRSLLVCSAKTRASSARWYHCSGPLKCCGAMGMERTLSSGRGRRSLLGTQMTGDP